MTTRHVVLLVVAVKLVLLAADATLRLYLGDSVAYLAGAESNQWLPRDRSFTYALAIRALVRPLGGLAPLLFWQAAAGVLTAALLWRLLTTHAGVAPRLAAAVVVLFAVEPAQLYYERMVLAETFGLSAFAGFLLVSAAYLDRPGTGRLIAVVILGLTAASLRLNYLPVVLVLSLALPWLLWFDARGVPARRTVLAHGIIAMAAVALIHTAYRQYVAMVFDVPPSYLAHAGFMRLGLVTPLVTPDQLERAGVPRDLVADLKYPLTDRRSRMAHMWAPGGLVHELRRRNLDVERIARTVSGFALREHPWGLVPLGVATVGDYFTARGIAHALDNDLGRRVVPDDLVEALRRNWRFDAAGLHERASPVSRYFELGTWWLVACLFALAPLALVNLALHWRTPQRPVVALVALASLGLVLAHVLFVAVAFYRYLHPLPFFVLANLVPVLAARRTKSGLTKRGLPHC